MTGIEEMFGSIKRSLPLLLAVSAAAALAALGLARSAGDTYELHYSYLISLSEREAASDFRFDGYYALSATDLFAATLAQWIATPELIVAAYKEAGVPLPADSPVAIGRAVKAVKVAPQLVAVTVRHKDQAVVSHLARGLQAVVEDNVARYHDEGIPAVRFRVVTTEPWVGVQSVPEAVIVTATFLFVLLAGVNIILLRESFRGR